MATVSVILLCGGVGSRMKSDIPKQYLEIGGKKIADYSFETFQNIEMVKEIVIVAEKQYHHLFSSSSKTLKFAEPGLLRQQSVYNGLKQVSSDSNFVCIHDAARPFINVEVVQKVIDAAITTKAATLGMPIKFTLKEVSHDLLVKKTVDRSHYYEAQTPQVIEKDILVKGFEKVISDNLEVTDDTSIVEHLNLPVKMVEGSYQNFKITTIEDLQIANYLIQLKKS